MKALLDINVLLDVLLAREPFFADSAAVWRACDEGRLRGFVSALSNSTVFYLARRIVGAENARAAVEQCLAAFEIVPVDRRILQAATVREGNDLEDLIQIECAESANVDCIISRDLRFPSSGRVHYTPTQLVLKLLSQ